MEGCVCVKYSSPPLCVEDTFQDPQWMPETAENTVYMLLHFFPVHTYPMVSLVYKSGWVCD